MSVAIAFDLVLTCAVPGFSQRRKAEPEANPQFQQQLKESGTGSGAPIGEPGVSSGTSETETAIGGADELSSASNNIQGIQIGSAAPPRAASPVVTSLLDARVTVRVKGAPLATFLDTISAQARINFIITEGLEAKRVTAFLQNVTVREALQVLLEIKGLSYQQIGKSNTYIVTPRSKQIENLITRIYTLNYIPLIPLSESGGGSGGSGSGAAGGTSASGGSASAGASGASSSAGGEVAILTVLQSIISKSGPVALDPRTNSLIVTDVPEIFPQIEQIITELDKKAPQVMIEAQIVEIESDRSKELGFDWGNPNTGQLGQFTAGSRDTSFPLQLPNDLSKTRFLDPVANQVGVIGGGGTINTLTGQYTGGLTSGLLDLSQLTVAVRALVTRTEGRFLGKPKIMTLNNKPAVIQISRKQATAITSSVSGGGSGITSAGTSVTTEQTGVQLFVTPQVNKDGYITMLIKPQFIDVQTSVFSSNANPVLDTITRSASTLVRVKNGQTLVLGGLLQTRENKIIHKVPFLGYIPLIGWMFSSVSNQRFNTDLVIFITPTIVSD